FVAVVEAGDDEGAGGQLLALVVVDQQGADGTAGGEAVFAFAGARELAVADDLAGLGAHFGGAGFGLASGFEGAVALGLFEAGALGFALDFGVGGRGLALAGLGLLAGYFGDFGFFYEAG